MSHTQQSVIFGSHGSKRMKFWEHKIVLLLSLLYMNTSCVYSTCPQQQTAGLQPLVTLLLFLLYIVRVVNFQPLILVIVVYLCVVEAGRNLGKCDRVIERGVKQPRLFIVSALFTAFNNWGVSEAQMCDLSCCHTASCNVSECIVQYNLVPLEGRWCSVAGKVTTCRSGITLAVYYRHQWFIHLQADGLKRGDEHPSYTPRIVWHTLPFYLDPVGWSMFTI